MIPYCRIDHSAAGSGTALVLCRPVAVLETRHVDEVADVLTKVEAAARRGVFAAGYVAYDAAPAFDPAFRVPGGGRSSGGADLPLAWFGLFEGAEPAGPLGAAAVGDQPRWVCESDRARHERAVVEIQEAIRAGTTYLVNYTTRFRRPWTAGDEPLDLYRRLVAGYGAGYHAYIETDEWALACGSPELFFEWSGRHLETRPVKGTAPRGRWAAEDDEAAARLASSPKERAENVMVVDLLRNDLGRIARPGSVSVPALGQLEQHPSLWQLSSTVRAQATSDVGLADVFGALFPCASVTGAPKIATMTEIADLEPSSRGVYCGTVGLLAPPGHGGSEEPVTRFAVAIRTAVVDKRRGVVEYGSGGGITCDSSPAAEWEEVAVKARGLTGSSAPVLGASEGLIETMGCALNGERGVVANLDRHLARLRSSARYFGLAVPAGMEQLVDEVARCIEHPTRVRLVLRAGAQVEITAAPLEVAATSPLRLCVDPEPVSSSDVRLFHKTTDRRVYDERMLRHPHADDVVLVNERGEVTETTRASLAVLVGGQWSTPPLGCGLLPGVERARRMAAGELTERVVTVADLHGTDGVATMSSLRGWRSAEIIDCSD